MVEMFDSGSYAAQDWAHLCAWDYFVGQWIYQRGLEKNVPTGISLLLTFNSGARSCGTPQVNDAASFMPDTFLVPCLRCRVSPSPISFHVLRHAPPHASSGEVLSPHARILMHPRCLKGLLDFCYIGQQRK
jgi:hypothetical protein